MMGCLLVCLRTQAQRYLRCARGSATPVASCVASFTRCRSSPRLPADVDDAGAPVCARRESPERGGVVRVSCGSSCACTFPNAAGWARLQRSTGDFGASQAVREEGGDRGGAGRIAADARWARRRRWRAQEVLRRLLGRVVGAMSSPQPQKSGMALWRSSDAFPKAG